MPRIFKQAAGVISTHPVWVCVWDGYLYIADTLAALLYMIVTEYRHDKHLVG